MNRHHPYGGYDTHRRGHPGPGRISERGGPRGRPPGRGRGGGGPPPPPAFNNNPYSQSNEYSEHGFENYPTANNGGDQFGSFNQGYGNYEGAEGLKPPRRIPRKEREDPVAREHLIEERIQRERPCRTLFIRNVKYETDSNVVRGMFEEHGEIKTFFDLISNRGMVFVTYYDLRAAERARGRLQGAELAGRPIDVHYSLPRADEQTGNADKEKNQGTLLITLRNSSSGQAIDETELRRKFSQIGDVKAIKTVNKRPDQRLLEYYDTRACGEAHERFMNDPMQDGILDLAFEWDVPELPLPSGGAPPTRPRDNLLYQDRGQEGVRGRGKAGPRGRGRGRGGGGGPNDWDHRFDDAEPLHAPPHAPRDRFSSDPNTSHTPPQLSYFPPVASLAPPAIPGELSSGPGDVERISQARQVQQLLAALKQPSTSTESTMQQPSYAAPPLPQMGMVQSLNPQLNNPMQYYPPPPAHQNGYSTAPSYGHHSAPPGYGIPPQSSPPPNTLANLPPHIVQLLQAQLSQSPPAAAAPASYTRPAYPSLPPQQSSAMNDGSYQQLMSLLNQFPQRPQQ